jgi:hypothetical protein
MTPRRWDADRRRQAAHLGAAVVQLAEITLADEMREVRDRTVAAGRKPPKFDDLARQSYVMGLAGDGDLLEVGVARGVFLNGCALTGRFGRLVGVDVRDYRPLNVGGWVVQICDVCDLEFADGEFDTVTAMEIIEHLPGDKMHDGIAQIRRVARSRLFTVPFCEQPLARYHHQAFDAERLATLFPDAEFTVLVKRRRGTPWVLIEERP